jgi:hypothetical protein
MRGIPAVLLAFWTVLAVSCGGGVPLRVRTEPSDVKTTVFVNNKKELEGKTPLELVVSDDTTIEIEEEGFVAVSEKIDPSAASKLPLKGEHHELVIELQRKEFEDVEQLLVIYNQKRGFHGATRTVRAFKSITERGGRVPTRLFEVPKGHGIRGIAMSPKGSHVVFAEATTTVENRDVAGPGENNIVRLKSCNLKAIKIGGGGVMQLTREDFIDLDPAYSPDGEHLLFSSNRRRPQRADLLRVFAQARAGGVADIYIDSRDFTVLRPSMGSNNATAFQLHPNNNPNQASQIWTIGGPNQYPTQITEGTQPSISPDGLHITFIGEDGNLYVVRSDGTGQTQLTTNAERIRKRYEKALTERELVATDWELFHAHSFPSWSPNGRFIVYSSMQGNDNTGRPNQDIWIMAADGTRKEQLTTNGSVDTFPVVTPDGKYIVFLSNRGERWAIWRMRAPTLLKQ